MAEHTSRWFAPGWGRRALRNALVMYPPLLLISPYLAYLIGRLTLGHWPVASIDDPKYIGLASAIAVGLASIVAMAMPCYVAAVVAALTLCVWTRDRGLAAYVALSMLLFIGAVAMIRWDPLGVHYWIAD